MRIGPVWLAANLLMYCRIDFKSVFKVLRLSTEMKFSTDDEHRTNVLKLITEKDLY